MFLFCNEDRKKRDSIIVNTGVNAILVIRCEE